MLRLHLCILCRNVRSRVFTHDGPDIRYVLYADGFEKGDHADEVLVILVALPGGECHAVVGVQLEVVGVGVDDDHFGEVTAEVGEVLDEGLVDVASGLAEKFVGDIDIVWVEFLDNRCGSLADKCQLVDRLAVLATLT
jgi:hypothetical protein